LLLLLVVQAVDPLHDPLSPHPLMRQAALFYPAFFGLT
jgi:hypothetical protein